MGTILPNGVRVEPAKLGRVRSSADQQWYYYTTVQEGLVLVSTISGQKVRLPEMDIVEILPSKEESNSVWIKTNGTAGFMERVKVELHNGKPLAEVKAPDCCAVSGANYDAASQTVIMVLQSPVTRRTRSWIEKTKRH